MESKPVEHCAAEAGISALVWGSVAPEPRHDQIMHWPKPTCVAARNRYPLPMSHDPAERWNLRYRQMLADPNATSDPIAPLIRQWMPKLPASGTALDIAGGPGRHAIAMAQHGLCVTLCDISSEGTRLAQQRAIQSGVTIQTVVADLTVDPFPTPQAGVLWDVIACFRYHQPKLFSSYATHLNPSGWLVFAQSTVQNLERHPRPSARFLLQAGQIHSLAQSLEQSGLRIAICEERWCGDHHEAHLVAQRREW